MLCHKFQFVTDDKERFEAAVLIFDELESVLRNTYSYYGCAVSMISTEGEKDYEIELKVNNISDTSLWDEVMTTVRFLLEELIY